MPEQRNALESTSWLAGLEGSSLVEESLRSPL
jgi:hypothetical protein